MYQVRYSKKAQKQIKKLDKQIQRFLFFWINKHLNGTDNPRNQGKGLTGDRANDWRYRIGDCRLICDTQDDKMVVLTLEFGHCK